MARLLKSGAIRHGGRAAILGLALLAALSVLFLTQLERLFIYFPTPEVLYTPDQVGLEYEDLYFVTADGRRLHAWYVPGSGNVTMLWFHGNGGNIGHRVEEIALIHRRLGVNQFIFDYRGYGKSQGKPSEQGIYKDADAAISYLQGRPDIAADRIVYFGRSLGAAVAVKLSVARPPQGLVLVAPFASISDMARLTFPYLPLHWLVRNRYNSLSQIRQVDRPLLILHGDRDDTVPLSQGQKLFGAANDPKQFQVLPGTGHNDTAFSGGSVYWDTLEGFLGGLPGDGSSSYER